VLEQLDAEGFDLVEVVAIAGEILRLAGERAIEARYMVAESLGSPR
jgi:hypothetical protein